MGFWDSFYKKSANSNVTNINAFKQNEITNTPGFNEEYASDIYNEENGKGPFDSYSDKGVCFENSDNSLKLVYNGLLAKNGAKDIYAVVGHGKGTNWGDVKYYPMNSSGSQSYELLLPVDEKKDINVAFKDGADNWDNNSGQNYKLM
jgi:hypothetical protein